VGQKVNPIGMRLGINRTWDSRWFAEKDYADLLREDIVIRKYIKSRLERAGISRIVIERAPKRVTVNIHTARPGIVIGRKGAEVDKLRDELQHLTGKEIYINIVEIRNAETDAQLVAENIVRQLEQRISYRRAMKRAVASAMRMGAQGIKVRCAGRLGGAEMARMVSYREGRVPLHTLRADIDYATATARTTAGSVGVQVWVFNGEVFSRQASES
jgi:small subunit ribosomal protein S3